MTIDINQLIQEREAQIQRLIGEVAVLKNIHDNGFVITKPEPIAEESNRG